MNFMISTRNCCFRRKRSSRNRRVHIRRVWCLWKRRTSSKYQLRVSAECEASGEFHDIGPKLLVSSGKAFSEQASPYRTSVVSLEAQNIIEVQLRVSVECVALTFCSREFRDFDNKLFFSLGEVFSEHAIPHQMGVVSLEAQNILEAPSKGLS